jgi:hypothetical protein
VQENMWVQIFWVACVGTAIVASVLATRSRDVISPSLKMQPSNLDRHVAV